MFRPKWDFVIYETIYECNKENYSNISCWSLMRPYLTINHFILTAKLGHILIQAHGTAIENV
jgi:hypothetical protein